MQVTTPISGRRGWRQAMAMYLRPRLLLVLIQGFASGLPLLLTLSTLSYWLAKVGVDKTTIGLFALTGTPYTFKFLWSPIIDQVHLPVLGRWLGRRRAWLFLIQILLAAAILAMGHTDPAIAPLRTAMAALVVAFLSASQDIVIDAYRIEILADEEQGAGAGATQTGYRLGLLLAGAGALALSDYLDWQIVFAVLAAAMLLSAIVTLIAPRAPEPVRPAPRNYREWTAEAVIRPLADFAQRRGWVVILVFILFYKFGDAIGGIMANPFYAAMGFSGSEIALVSKLWGVWMTVLGGLIGGILVARIGMFRTLMIGGVLQALTNFTFCIVAWRGHDLYALTAAITADNLAGGAAGAAMVAYLSRLTNIAFTATQYALLTSFMAYGRTLMSAGGGWLADQMDWASFFALTALLAVPGLLLLYWLSRLYPGDDRTLVEKTA
ncbi:AmpG family muropeptide MFS transporter [Dongia soli]|uniref:MFS transporter n=1 Tax=Dongia soli TaxID=600628 RepID=A0ABU5E7R8_9PROT|nr:MFS transporter [Dongia soli]MDY0881886.1 MFS transporter [Dongia soli]